MKRAFAVLLCVLSVFICVYSQAEEYYQYGIHDQYYGPFAPEFFGDNNVLYRAWGDRDGNLNLDWHLLWYRDGSLFRDFAYSADQRFNQAVFLPREDNTCAVLIPGRREREKSQPDYDPVFDSAIAYTELYEWTENGLESLKKIPGKWDWLDIQIADDGFLAYDGPGGMLSFFDSYGNLLYEMNVSDLIPPTEIRGTLTHGNLVDVTGKMTEKCVISFRTEWVDAYHSTYMAICMDQMEEKWRREFLFSPGFSFPGDGYFYRAERDRDSRTPPVKIIRLGPNGEDMMTKTLSADNLVLGCHLAVSPRTGKLMLYGSAVANSRKIYTVFKMDLDENMNQAALDVRAIDYYRDYAPAVKMQKDGTLFVHCDGGEKVPMNAPTVLIPYDVLPAAESHGLRLR